MLPSAPYPVGRRIVAVFALALLGLGTGCADNGTGPGPVEERAVGVVLNSVDLSLTIFDVEDPSASPRTVGLAPDGSPVSLAVRDGIAVVPLGFVSAIAVVDLGVGALLRTIALPDLSGATGVAFVNDSIVLAANPGRNSVSSLNVLSGELGPEVPVGVYPQAISATDGNLVVVNAELGLDFLPAGPGTLTVLDGSTLAEVASVALSGFNPGSVAQGSDGSIYVVHSGHFGAGDGSVSVVDPGTWVEREHYSGFGEFPFGSALDSMDRLYVSSFAFGVTVWDTEGQEFVHDPTNAVQPEGVPSTAGLGVDESGRLYVLRPDCAAPSAVHRLSPTFEIEVSIPVGTCPIALTFGRIRP